LSVGQDEVNRERHEWARSYALQALFDLRAREVLARAGTEKCHRLHFLQMAAEKICKAHLTAANGHENVHRTHAYVENVLPVIARNFYGNQDIPTWQMREIRRIAREIEVIAPACDAGNTREDNSEYPWVDGQGAIQTPCRHNFPNIDDSNKMLVSVIKLMRSAAEAYTR
jgi:hypothetical protein